jgi:hypothetical protein
LFLFGFWDRTFLTAWPRTWGSPASPSWDGHAGAHLPLSSFPQPQTQHTMYTCLTLTLVVSRLKLRLWLVYLVKIN